MNENNIIIYSSQISDISAMVSLSKAKRLSYKKAPPQFSRYEGEGDDNTQRKWFNQLLEDKNHVMFTTVESCHPRENGDPVLDSRLHGNDIIEFIIAELMPAPKVYNPGGLTLMITTCNPKTGHRLIEDTKARKRHLNSCCLRCS